MKSRWFSGNSALQIGGFLLKLVACSANSVMVKSFFSPAGGDALRRAFF
jgi:hypothetical protein